MKSILKISHATRRDTIVLFKLLLPLFFVGFVTYHFEEFVIYAVEANLAINSGILLTALFGVVIIFFRMLGTQKDFRIVERFGKEANAGTPMNELLEQPWLKGVYVRHYLEHIANTGGTLSSQIDQNAIENELHALQSEYNNRMELPQFLVGFMIALGLLGTFIGLLETLTGISSMLDGMGNTTASVDEQFAGLITELRKPLAGMGIAFSASMFGLVGSLMLAMMMINLRRFTARLVSLARNVMHDLTVIAANTRIIHAPGQSRADPSLNSPISNSSIAGRFDLLTRKIEALLEAFEVGTNNTQRMVDLMSFGPRMKEISERTLDEIKAHSAKSSDQQRALQTIIENQSGDMRATADLIELLQQTKEIQDESLQTIKTLAGAEIFFSQRRDQEFRDRLFTDIKNLTSIMADQKKIAQSLVDVGTNNVRGLDNIVQNQKDNRSEQSALIGRLIESIQKVEEIDIGGARHLYEIKERLIKLCNNLAVVDIIASGISGQSVLLETLVQEVRGSNQEEQDGNDIPNPYQAPEEY